MGFVPRTGKGEMRTSGAFGVGETPLQEPAESYHSPGLGNNIAAWLEKFHRENGATRAQECEFCGDSFFTLFSPERLRHENLENHRTNAILCGGCKSDFRSGKIKADVESMLRKKWSR